MIYMSLKEAQEWYKMKITNKNDIESWLKISKKALERCKIIIKHVNGD